MKSDNRCNRKGMPMTLLFIVGLFATVGVWLFYAVGQGLHLLLGAHLSLASKLNSVTTYREYFLIKAVPLACRLFLVTMAFILVWDNPKVVDLSGLAITTLKKCAFAGLLGFFSDSLFDKVMGFIPLTNKELPPVETLPEK